MAVITFTIPDAVVQRVLDAYATTFSYSPILMDGTTNPETKAAFTKRMITNQIKGIVKASEGGAANTTAQNNVETQIPIT